MLNQVESPGTDTAGRQALFIRVVELLLQDQD